MHNTEFCKDDFYIVLIFFTKKEHSEECSVFSVYFSTIFIYLWKTS